jgi:pyrroloquinoline quinone biosynthesis protein B
MPKIAIYTEGSPRSLLSAKINFFCMKKLLILLVFTSFSCQTTKKPTISADLPQQFITVLGIAQDAGYPQPYCGKICCEAVEKSVEKRKNVTCLGIVDRETQQVFLLDATPDFTEQQQKLRGFLTDKSKPLSGILLTHAHIGHYTGLMYLGREAIGARETPVFAMPKMKNFIETNAPWSQLVTLKNIKLMPLKADSSVEITKNISIKPIIVPHRDEFSETVGYIISTKNKRVLFIPDIDKWAKWQRNIIEEVSKVDVALLDATFYQNGEIPNRDMSEIPHPFMEETIGLFKNSADKSKIKFIHFNHTNPVLRQTKERQSVENQGFGVCTEGSLFSL